MVGKKIYGIIGLSVLVGITAIATVSGSIAWLNRTASIDNKSNISGSAQIAYFGGGDGTSGDPYIINKPVHLYNLAWLQYIGYFKDNQTDAGGGSIDPSKQPYFLMNADIDMSSFNSALPPIGTSKYPFVGNFNGGGHTISSILISNDFKDTNKHPSVVNSLSDVECVGLFGVVGKMPNQTFTYNSNINQITNLGILDATIKSSTSKTLIGIAGGYVNADLDNVGVNDSNLYTKESATALDSDITTNISDYSLVGFATNEHKGKMRLRSEDADIPTLENPNTDSGGSEWGGSINMLDMYNYLRGLDDSSSPYSFVSEETVENYVDGSSSTTTTSTKTNAAYMGGGFKEFYRYHQNKVIEDEKEYASFTFVRSSNYDDFEPYNDADDRYICLYGGKNIRGTTASSSYWSGGSTNQENKTVTTNNHFYRISNGTSNYLRYYDGDITNTTSSSYASGWKWDGNYLKTTVSSTDYYLSISSGSLSASTTKTTQWTYSQSDTNLYATSGGKTYYLDFDGSNWRLVSTSSTYYLINSGTHYMTHTYPVTASAKVGDTSTGSEPTSYNARWYYVSNGGYFSATESGTMYYLRRNKSNIYYTNDTSNRFVASAEYGNNVTLSYNGNYVRYSGGWNNTNSSNTVKIIKKTAQASDPHGITMTESTSSSSSTVATYYDTAPTYFPLTRDKDNETGKYTGSGKPDEMNTGYIVSGSNLTDSTQGPYGDIRVSHYPMSSLNNSLGQSTYDDNKLEVVTRTSVRNLETGNYVDSGWTRISDEYNSENESVSEDIEHFVNKKDYKKVLHLNKYKSSRSQLGSTLSSGDSEIYGLHFMNAAISKDRVVEGKNITVLDGKTKVDDKDVGTYYETYDLPQDSIDFHLKNQGFINFFAGTYFTNNNAFFSLHKIDRDVNHKITNIRQIKKIYAPLTGDPSEENPYVYSYDGNRPTGYTDDKKLAFDVSWITSPDMVENAVYYFEIPVNSGEYALGSVSGTNGAYLMYLDIGAGIGNYKDIVTTENISSTVKDSAYPFGIDFQTFTVGSERDEVVGGNTASIKILNGKTNQTLNYNYQNTSSTLNVTVSNEVEPSININYSNVGVGVNKVINQTSSALTFSPPVLYEMVDNKVTYESYNVFTSTVTRTVSQEYTITGGKTGLQIQLPKPLVSDGFTITTPISYSATGPATITSTDGLLTFNSSGTVNVTMTYVETMTNVDQWETASHITSDDTEGTIIGYHFRDYVDPNTVIRFVYDGQNYTYTLYITSSEDTTLYIDSLPLEGYTVVIIVNNDETNKTTLISTSETESIDIVGA